MSAPPNISPSSSPSKSPFVPTFSPPQSKFEPDLPEFDIPSFDSPPSRASGKWNFVSTIYSPPSRLSKYEDIEVPLRDEDDAGPSNIGHIETEPVPEFDEVIDEISEDTPLTEEQSDEDKHNAVIQQRIADGGMIAKLPRESLLLDETKPMSLLTRFLLLILFGVSSYLTYEYKAESASIGYCDAGSDTNRVLESLRSTQALIAECNQQNRSTLYDPLQVPDSPLCPVESLLVHPDSCTPCPEHGICFGHAVTCEKPYILNSPLLLSFLAPSHDPSNTTLSTSVPPSDMAWKVISELFDGLPLLGSVAFPPTCAEDPKRKKRIGAVGNAIEALLAQHRGALLCNAEAENVVEDVDGGEAKRWGMRVNMLKETMRQGTNVYCFNCLLPMSS